MYTTCASAGVSKLMVLPFSRSGVSCRQKGPRMADAVRPFVLLVAALKVMWSTSLPVSQRQHERCRLTGRIRSHRPTCRCEAAE